MWTTAGYKHWCLTLSAIVKWLNIAIIQITLKSLAGAEYIKTQFFSDMLVSAMELLPLQGSGVCLYFLLFFCMFMCAHFIWFTSYKCFGIYNLIQCTFKACKPGLMVQLRFPTMFPFQHLFWPNLAVIFFLSTFLCISLKNKPQNKVVVFLFNMSPLNQSSVENCSCHIIKDCVYVITLYCYWTFWHL